MAREDQKRKIPLEPDQMFCMACKKGRHPIDSMAHFQFKGRATVTLKGICPECRSQMNKQTSSKALNQIVPLYKKVTREELDRLRTGNNLVDAQKPAEGQSLENDMGGLRAN